MGARLARACLVTSLATALGAAGAVAGTTTAVAGAHLLTITGRVQVVIANGGMLNDREFMTLRSHGHRYQLRLPGDRVLPSRTEVSVTGSISRGTFTASKMRVLAVAPPVATTGNQSTYVIRVAWSGNPADSTTSGNVTTALTSVSNWFNEVSYAQLPGLTVSQDTTFEPIAAPSGCSTQTGGGAYTIYDEAVAAAGQRDPNFHEANFDHVVIYFPMTADCQFAGLAEVGGSKVWVNGELDNRVLTHELGHNLGLSHAHSQVCHNGAATVTVSTDCDPPNEYGDPADTMGSEGSGAAGHYNAAQKDKLGWLAAAKTAPCTTLTLQPYEGSTAAGVLSAQIDAGSDPATGAATSYWLEYRHPPTSTIDSALGSGVLGVLLHRTDPVASNPLDVGPDLLDGQPGTGSDFSDALIPAPSGTVTTPEGYTISVTAAAGSASVGLSTTMPSVPQQVAASAGTSGVDLSWSPPACLAGAGSVSSYNVGVFGGNAPVTTTSTHATITGLTPDSEHEFLVSATAGGKTGASAIAPMSAPDITGWEDDFSNGFTLSFNRSVSNGGQQILGYLAHAVPAAGGAETTSYFDNGTPGETVVPIADAAMTPGSRWNLWITPLLSDFTDGPASSHVSLTVQDNIAPVPHVTAPTAAWTRASSTNVKWSAVDSGGAGVESYDVRYREASYNGGFGSYSYPAAWQATTETSATLALSRGTTYCFSTRARDHNLNLSGWSAQRCTAVPLDDRSLKASTGWTRGRGTAFYVHTILSSTHLGAKLSRTSVHARHLVLVVTKCPGCGSVAVYAGSKKLRTVNLAATSTRNRVVVSVPTSALSGVTISIKIVSTRKPVKIDGLGVSAA